jgi:hypothetical protein
MCGADLPVCRFKGPLAPRRGGDSGNGQVGDLPRVCQSTHTSEMRPDHQIKAVAKVAAAAA